MFSLVEGSCAFLCSRTQGCSHLAGEVLGSEGGEEKEQIAWSRWYGLRSPGIVVDEALCGRHSLLVSGCNSKHTRAYLSISITEDI